MTKHRIYFTSDTHLNHGNIIKYSNRPFLGEEDMAVLERSLDWGHASGHRISPEAVELMDDTLIDNINAIVEDRDHLFHLGDFGFGDGRNVRERTKDYLDRLRCKNVTLIWGNHDKCEIGSLFSGGAHDIYNLRVDGQLIVLCHYAMATWNRSHRGSWHLYGHSHAAAEGWLDDHMPGRRSMDVGVDNACLVLGEYRPFSYGDIKSIMDGRQGYAIDHHTPTITT